MPIRTPLAALSLALLLTGCSGILMPGNRAYAPFIAPSRAEPDELFYAAQRVFADIPGGHVRVGADGRTVTAWTAPRSGIRDRYRVETLANGIGVSVQTEMRDSSGRWQHAGMSCAEYGFSRERALASEVLSRVGRPDDSPMLVAGCSDCVRAW